MSPSPVAVRERPGLPFYCPRCPERRSTEQSLGSHLIDTHGLVAHEAALLASAVAQDVADRRHHPRAVPPARQEEPAHAASEAQAPTPETGTMSGARKCGNCQKPGHRADRCTEKSAGPKRAGGGKRSTPEPRVGSALVQQLRAAANDYEKKAALLRETAETLEGP